MILNIAALLFVLGITFVNSMFGLYSGIINVFCCVTALAVAFGYAEALNGLLTEQFHWHPAYTEPFALVLLFIITLLILRTLADMYMRGNVKLPMYADWGGGAVCGFIIAQICVGVMVLGFLMLPLGGRVAMFSRYERDPDNLVDPETQRVKWVRKDLWLKSDQFAVGLFDLLSSGSLKGNTRFASVYPDFPEWVFWSGNTVQHESLTSPIRDDTTDGFEDGMAIEGWWKQAGQLEGRYRKLPPNKDNPKPAYEPTSYRLRPGHELIGMRLLLNEASAERSPKRGSMPFHRFRPSMIRLVGDLGDQSQEYVPQVIGGADSRIGDNLRIVDLDANFAVGASGDTPIDVYFEVETGFKPRFIEYRRHAREPVTAAAFRAAAPSTRLAAARRDGEETRGGPRGHGPARFIDAVDMAGTGENSRLPVAMSVAGLRREQVVLAGDRLESGRVTGDVADLAGSAADRQVERFSVPSDLRIFQLRTRARQAQSLAGQVMNFVGSVTNQYEVVSNTGDTYPLAGYYAIVERNGQQYIELFFTPDPTGRGFRGMLDFQTDGIRSDLRNQDDAILGLIFVLPPGTTVSGVRSQGGGLDFGGQEWRMSGR